MADQGIPHRAIILDTEPRATLALLMDYLFGTNDALAPRQVSLKVDRGDLYTIERGLSALPEGDAQETESLRRRVETLCSRLHLVTVEEIVG